MNPHRRALFLAGIALLSLSGMLMEIALTRIFSVLFFYHYAFAILSIAVLGIGLGATVIHQWGDTDVNAFVQLQSLTLLTGAATLGLAFVVIVTVPVDSRLLLVLVTALPYTLIGMTLATVFTTRPSKSPTLYWADMGGAGLGAAAAIPLLNLLEGLDVLLLIAALFAVSSIGFRLAGGTARSSKSHSRSQGSDHWHAIGTAILLLLVVGGLTVGDLDIDVSRLATPKPLTRRLQEDPQTRIVYTQWDAFARTDVLESNVEPWQKQVFINGAAGSMLPRYPLHADEETRITDDIGYFPFRQASGPERVLIIGPGGGKDVLFGLLSGSKSITAVEVSPGVVDAVRHFGDYSGRLFDHPNVDVFIDEGRSYLRRSQEQFDLISLSEVIALTAERGSYILAENYVYTTEGFHDYLDHLTPGGRLALRLYDELTLTRAFVTAVAALQERGLTEAQATRHVVVLLDPELVSREAPFRSPLLILYRDPLTPERASQLLASIHQADFLPLFVPYVHEYPPLSDLATGKKTLESLVDGFSRADISPTTDARPFFYEFHHGLPGLLRQLLIALAAVTVLALIYLGVRRRTVQGPFWPLALYFALLGVGYMLMELSVIQRLTLFLGHPTTAFSVSLFAILASSGLGSLVGGRLAADRPWRTILIAAAIAGLLALAYVGLIPALTQRLLSLPLAARIVAAWILIFPLFFALGLPFPVGLQAARRQAGRPMISLAWGINGLMAIVGSTGAMAIAIVWSFDGLLIVGSLIYGTVALLTMALRNTTSG